MVWYRMLLATGFILLFLLVRKHQMKLPWKTLGGYFIAGLLIALHWLAFFGAIKVSNVSVTLAVMSTGALFTSFLEPLYYRRKIIGYEVIFGLLVVVGLYIIFRVETQYVTGILLALAASLLGSMFSVINGKFAKKQSATVISFYELLFGVLCITLYLAFAGDFDASFFKLSSSDWMYLLILASFCTAYAFIASIHVMKWLSPYTVMLTINLEPVYGIILALLVLGDAENMSPEFYYGALIILLTVIANGIVKTRRTIKKGSDISN